MSWRIQAPRRLRRAAFAPSLPSALRVLLGSRDIVRFRFATPAAFLMLRRAAAVCFALGIELPECDEYVTPRQSMKQSSARGTDGAGGRYFAGWRTELGRKSCVSW
jgi:hypothetical protein